MTSDADGNTLTDNAGRVMSWDSQNRMTSCAYQGTASTFTYGADGFRRSETVTPSGGSAVTTRSVYDGTMLVQEQRGTGAFATYLNGLRGPECRVDETQPAAETGYTSGKTTFQCGPAKWYVYDGLGSVVGEVDPSGNLTSNPKYDVYGLVRSNAGTASSAMGFVGGLGHLSEAGTGLIYMRARYYDPALGRFASEDSKRSGMNWFVYCNSNPINQVDATGTTPEGDEVVSELLEKTLSVFDFLVGIKAQEWVASKAGGALDKFYVRIFGESPFEQITKADAGSADAGTDELMVEYEIESKVQVDNIQAAGKTGTEVVIEADEEDALR